MPGDRRRTAVSLFSGAGGLDLGLERAGFQLLTQVDCNDDCVSTLRHAARDTSVNRVVKASLEDLNPHKMMAELGLRAGELDLIAGGPPCQPFTTTGKRQALNDGRAESSFPAWLGWLRAFRPRTFVMENVTGLLSAALRHRPLKYRENGTPLAEDEQKGSFLRWLLDEFLALGYSATWGIVEAADYGVPQLRQRAVVIGVCGDEPCFFPAPTHGPETERPYRTLRQAIGRIKNVGPVQPLSAAKVAVFSRIAPGENWRSLPPEVARRTMGAAYAATGGKNGWWRRLSWTQPAPTILGMPDHSSTGLIHPDEVRCLSVRECAAIQTFAVRHPFHGSPRSQYQQIGNAVPVRLGEALGTSIANCIDGKKLPKPTAPQWRSQSANQRIGVHGWVCAESSEKKTEFSIIVKVRDDHVWSRVNLQQEIRFDDEHSISA
jgi:DNA (cytosine-5)-methyltransferase 1